MPVNLNPGQSLTGSVSFKPSAAQAYSGSLEFKRSNGSTNSIALSGTGTQFDDRTGGANNLLAASKREDRRGTNGNF